MNRLGQKLGTAAAVVALTCSGLSAEEPGDGTSPGTCEPDDFANGVNLWRAVSAANENGVPDTIDLAPACTYRVPTTLEIGPDPGGGNATELTIHGHGAVIKRKPRSPDERPFRVIDVLPGAKLNLDGVAVSGGRTVPGDGGGAGIRVGYEARLILTASQLRFNASPDEGAALAVHGGAGVLDTIIRDNKAGPDGSTVVNHGRLEIAQTTISHNLGRAGSSVLRNLAFASVSNTTVTGNEGQAQAVDNSGRLFVAAATIARNAGAGILNRLSAAVRGSIVADNGGAGCAGETVTGGPNLTDDGTCPGVTGPRLLGVLADNGGPTPTRAPGPGSAAVNPGPCAGGPPLYRESVMDQRGVPRDANCDFGAVEVVDSDGDGIDDGVEARAEPEPA